MDDYIKREDAVGYVLSLIDRFYDGTIAPRDIRKEAKQQVMNEMNSTNILPAADVRENVRGEWEYHDYGLDENGRDYHEIECSACHVKLPMIREVDFDFCPWCGADMRGINDV